MKSAAGERRSVWLVNPRFQLTFLGFTLGLAALTTSIFYGANLYFFSEFRAMGTAMSLPVDHAYFQFIQEQENKMRGVFIVTSVATSWILMVLGFVMSHRIAGPLYRLRQHFLGIANGSAKPGPVKFRDHDYFSEVADAYNSTLSKDSRNNGSSDRRAA